MGFTCGAIACCMVSLWISCNAADTRKRAPKWLLRICQFISRYCLKFNAFADELNNIEKTFSRPDSDAPLNVTTIEIDDSDFTVAKFLTEDDIDFSEKSLKQLNESNIQLRLDSFPSRINSESTDSDADEELEVSSLNLDVDDNESIVLLFSLVQENSLLERDLVRLRQWLYIALVIDRVFFVCFSIVSIILIFIVFVLPSIYSLWYVYGKPLC